MKRVILVAMVVIVGFAACRNKKTSGSQDESTETTQQVSETISHDNLSTDSFTEASELLSGRDLPQHVDLTINIDSLSLQELRLLYNYVYATHGFYSLEDEINSFFMANTTWYKDLVYELWDKGEMPQKYEDVALSREELNFIYNVDKRIKQLQRDNFIRGDRYTLGNTENIVNEYQFNELSDEFKDKLEANNFVIIPSEHVQLFHTYEENDYRKIPSFITTDLFLQAFHMYFSYTLKSLEQQQFIPLLEELCMGMYTECMRMAQTSADPEIKQMALYNATYYAIPYRLLTGKDLKIPAVHQADYKKEIENIGKQEDKASAFLPALGDVYFPYSLYKPRGHYTRKPEMEAYFRAMMWLQVAPFCRDNKEQLKQTILSAVLLNTAQSANDRNLISIYNAIYEPIVFLIGLPDNLSVMDIAAYLKQRGINSLHIAFKEDCIADVNQMLVELAETRNVIRPEIEISCPDKINFMPQRYLVDNEVLQNLVDITPNSERAYPKGLDVFAAFGSAPAMNLLNNFYREPEKWEKYPEKMQQMQDKFRNYGKWNSSVYNKWIESLLELQKPDKSYPHFMQTEAWDKKNLNTSLASWAELKHDAILYGEQPMAAECGGGDDNPPVPVVKGYVEPNLKFWNKLAETISLTHELLEKHQLMTPDLQGKLEQLDRYTTFLIKTTLKELRKEELSEGEYRTIQYMGSSMEYFTLSVIDPDLYLPEWSLVEGPDRSIAVVADIFTRNVYECSKSGILHVATGKANSIYVVVEINGFLHLTRGSTFSYYEFVQPLGTRLTDEEWQKMLEEHKAPAVPEWMDEIQLDAGEPKVDERVFYSSGC